MKRFLFVSCLVAVLCVAAPGAMGQAAFPMFDNVSQGLLGNSNGNPILGVDALREAARAFGNSLEGQKGAGEVSASASEATSTVIPKPEGTAGIDVLVAGYSDAQKPEMRKLFGQMIDMFDPVAKKLDVPVYDMGSAAAALIAGSYAAYHNQTLPDAHFKPLAVQMQQVFAKDANFAKASTAEKQRMYQIMVGTGMFLTLIQLENAKKPDPQVEAQLKTAGADFLQKFTRINPAQITLGAGGMGMTE